MWAIIFWFPSWLSELKDLYMRDKRWEEPGADPASPSGWLTCVVMETEVWVTFLSKPSEHRGDKKTWRMIPLEHFYHFVGLKGAEWSRHTDSRQSWAEWRIQQVVWKYWGCGWGQRAGARPPGSEVEKNNMGNGWRWISAWESLSCDAAIWY